jgi:hypothetical protein
MTNALWFFFSDFSGPLIGLIFYAALLYVCIYKRHFQAGIIVGIAGFSIHILELLFSGIPSPQGIGRVCFWVNLILPAFLVYFSHIARRESG